MNYEDALFLPAHVRYRTGRSRPTAHRGVRSSGSRSSGSRTEDSGSTMMVGGLDAPVQIGESLAAWGYVYQVGTQTVAVGSNVNFSNNGPLNGVTHTPGTGTVTVTAAGIYNFNFAVYTSQNNPQDWAMVVNGIVQYRFNSAGQTILGTASLSLSAGDRVTIRNVATLPDPATLRSGDFVTAYLVIYKVDS